LKSLFCSTGTADGQCAIGVDLVPIDVDVAQTQPAAPSYDIIVIMTRAARLALSAGPANRIGWTICLVFDLSGDAGFPVSRSRQKAFPSAIAWPQA
jgi:hypothetical protein